MFYEPVQALTIPIDHHEHRRKKPKPLCTVADVLYHGFRCGILHEAHIPLYGSIDPGGPAFQETTSGLATYASSGRDCPNITVNPLLLLDDLKDYFGAYLARLKDKGTRNDALRSCFKAKFADSFGINV